MMVDLPATFQRALDTVVGDLTSRGDLVGILFFGSAARGDVRAGSDVDLYAITAQDIAGHVGRSVDGVPVEVSFGSLAQMETRVRQDVATVVHALATGRLLMDLTSGALPALCREARIIWDRGPASASASALLRYQFHLTDLARDLEAMPEHSAATALTASECVRLSIEALCAKERIWMPQMRSALGTLGATHPDIADMMRHCADRGFPASVAKQLAERILERLGGRLDTYDTVG
jgi:predicted nucleotidyltransferase